MQKQTALERDERKGCRRVGSLRKWTVKRICSALSAFNHHRFVLSIGQHESPPLLEIHLSRVTTSCICDGADIPIWKWQYQLIYFSLSPILSYYITTRKDNTVEEKGLVLQSESRNGYYYRLTTHNYVFEAFKYTESFISSYSPSSLSTVEIHICFIV